jgi:hypothetical protein
MNEKKFLYTFDILEEKQKNYANVYKNSLD